MLVLTRKLKETIRIGDDITITVVRVRPNSVRIGVEAPQHIRVVRGELTPKLSETHPDMETRMSRGEAVVIERDEAGGCEDFSDEWLVAAGRLVVSPTA